jgi:hypothetical protein
LGRVFVDLFESVRGRQDQQFNVAPLASAFTLSINALVPEALAKPFRSFLFVPRDFAAIDYDIVMEARAQTASRKELALLSHTFKSGTGAVNHFKRSCGAVRGYAGWDIALRRT